MHQSLITNSNYREQLDATVQNCVYTYTSDWVVVRRKYHHHSSSIRPIDDLDVCLKEPLEQQEFEIDDTPDVSPDFEHVSKLICLSVDKYSFRADFIFCSETLKKIKGSGGILFWQPA